MLLSTLAYEITFCNQPFYFAVQLLEDLIYERDTSENTRGLCEQTGSCGCSADDETAIVEGRCVFG